MTEPSSLMPSPCLAVCDLDPTQGLCAGCQRTAPEIGAWRDGTPETRAAIWDNIRQRRNARGLPPHPRDPAGRA